MLLAIDVGNTHSVYGLWNGSAWAHVWRRSTSSDETEDQLAAWLRVMFDMSALAFAVDGVVCASVVPQLNRSLDELASERFSQKLVRIDSSEKFGLRIAFSPSSSIGADRLANCLGALDKWEPPIVVVDFGTATTFDAIDKSGAYLGGAILPGIEVSTEALISRAAKLPRFELQAPERAIGRSTSEALQSGVVLGYSGAIDSLARRIDEELGSGSKIIATGGLGSRFVDWCESIELYDPNLTLDGLRIAYEKSQA